MAKPLFSKSARKHIRLEKALIRREVSDTAIQGERIGKLLESVSLKKQEKRAKVSAKKTEVAGTTKEK
jgi:hypothetical protein